MPEENKKPTYRMLGELGFSKPVDPAFQQKISNRFNDFGVLADLDDKTNPSYWHFYYDPRYCGPDPEAWMEKMVAKARAEQELAKAIEKAAKVSATRCIFSRNIKWVYINRNGDIVREA